MSRESKQKFLEQTLDNETQGEKQIHVFILVNSRSGSWHGRELIQSLKTRLTIHHTHFYAADLYSRQHRETCFAQIKQLSKAGECVRILMGGGDGTVQWVISQAINFKLDFQKVIFGVLPIGTGNDFAKSVGWGDYKFTVNRKKFQELAVRLSRCEVEHYDIWECKITSQGRITEIKNGVQRRLKGKQLKKIFSNYFGIGTDARITYYAQKINAKSVLMKKISYGFAWIASLCRSSQRLANKLKSFTNFGTESETSMKLNKELELSNSVTVTQSQNLNLQSQIQLNQNDACITFLNSTFSMELGHIWNTPHSIEPNKIYKPQKIDDGLIELVSYRNEFSIMLERSFHMAKKVAQGEGPFLLRFKQTQKGKREESYIHINGQPYKIQNLESVEISKSRDIPYGKIKILVYKQ